MSNKYEFMANLKASKSDQERVKLYFYPMGDPGIFSTNVNKNQLEIILRYPNALVKNE